MNKILIVSIDHLKELLTDGETQLFYIKNGMYRFFSFISYDQKGKKFTIDLNNNKDYVVDEKDIYNFNRENINLKELIENKKLYIERYIFIIPFSYIFY